MSRFMDKVVLGLSFFVFLVATDLNAKTVITPDGTIIVCTTDKNGITVCI